MNNLFPQIEYFFEKPLFIISGTAVTLVSIIFFILIIIFSIALSLIVQHGLKKALASKFAKQDGTLAALLRLIHYTVVIVGFGIGLQTIGINLGALFAAGAEVAAGMVAK